jgi:hypothetical protein
MTKGVEVADQQDDMIRLVADRRPRCTVSEGHHSETSAQSFRRIFPQRRA